MPDVLVLAADSEHNSTRVRWACERAGLRVAELSRDDPEGGLPAGARPVYRVPVGLATRLHARGVDLALAHVPPDRVARLPRHVTGRGLQALTVAQLLVGDVALDDVRMVKLAAGKHRGFTARRVPGLVAAQELTRASGLPEQTVLLLADGYLDCDSEYRTFTVGREVVALSPYLVEGESWSAGLVAHRASFHDEAAAFVERVLAELPLHDVPPACVVDVARLPSGELRLLEVNTAWGAGLYGCDPEGVLRSVLAANGCADGPWRWRPDPGLLRLVEGDTDA